jgi:(2Fe-2S) ferredoxin
LAKFERHVFICTNHREPGSARPSCTAAGKSEIHTLFKDALRVAGKAAEIRANKAGCLDQCEHGPTIVVYPEGVWYGFVQPENVQEIVQEHLIGGRPVERLRLDESCLNTATCPHRAVK